jgi:hypothetical protein
MWARRLSGERPKQGMTNRTIVVICVLVIAGGVLIDAQRGTVRYASPQPRSIRLIESLRPEGRTETKVAGTILDLRRAPVPRARIQLRDLSNGLVVQEGLSNDAGDYEFTVAEPGTYVVEMVDDAGRVIGLSSAGALSQFQTMAAMIQLPGRWDLEQKTVIVPQSNMRFIGMSANNTMTATTIQFAAQENVPPADPGEPVSP